MKNTLIIALFAAITASLFAFITPPKKATVTIKASGTCAMCKERIEAALDKPGIYKAIYDFNTQIVTITYNQRKLELIQLHNLIAGAGHDTDKVKASDQAYADLPECCQYRSGAKCTDH